MAIVPSDEYPGQTNDPNADYPQGSARDVSVPGAGDGTPWRARVVNDLFGFQQGLLNEASLTPSGNPDTATASQYVEAVNTMITAVINALNLAQQIEDGAETVFDDNVAAPDAALASLIDQRSESVFDAEVADPDAALVALINSQIDVEEQTITWDTPTGYVDSAGLRLQRQRNFVVARVRMSTTGTPSGTVVWSGAIPAGLRISSAVVNQAELMATEADGVAFSNGVFRVEVNDSGDVTFDDMGTGNTGGFTATIAWPISGFGS